jgi:probable phosphoglycerate mutase
MMEPMSALHKVVLLRHGETQWSRDGRHTGRTDVPLTDEGERRAAATAPLLNSLKLVDPLVVCSPRSRARHTAELAGLRIDRVWDDLAEWDYGDYEGLTTPQIRRSVPHWTVWTHPCPGGESAETVQSRADTVLAVASSRLESQDVVLVGHGHFSRVLIARWCELPVVEGRRFALSPAGITVLSFEHDDHTVAVHNLTAALG